MEDSCTFWSLSDAFAFDNDVLAEALRSCLSDCSSSPVDSTRALPSSSNESKPDADSERLRIPNPNPKIAKRKKGPRISKKVMTTYITADPANFSRMVQQATGGAWFGQPVTDPNRQIQPPTFSFSGSGLGPGSGSGSKFILDASFPTLESWSGHM